VERCGLDASGSGYWQLPALFEDGDDLSRPIKNGEFLDEFTTIVFWEGLC
jgi:hypothetical protein